MSGASRISRLGVGALLGGALLALLCQAAAAQEPAAQEPQVVLPEVRVTAPTPRVTPRRPRRAAPAPAPAPVRHVVRRAAPAPVSPASPALPSAPKGTGAVEPDKFPGNTDVLTAGNFDHSRSSNLLEALSTGLPGVTLGDQSGNPFQRDLNYRGFIASPVQGTPQGLAVYQNGIRINESFGDVVNWLLSRKPRSSASPWCRIIRSTASTRSAAP